MRTSWVALGLVLAAGAEASEGTPIQELRRQSFEQKDRDRDGYLTGEEYAGHPGNFRYIDRNGDGRLSLEEFLNRGREEAAKGSEAASDGFGALDRNRDGVLSRAEWRGDARAFARLDRDHDGTLSREEHAHPPQPGPREERFLTLDDDGDGALSRREWPGPFAFFRLLDANADRVLSRDEYARTDRLELRFEELDEDRDGVVTLAEWGGHADDFEALDGNRDGELSRPEFLR